MTDDGLIKLAAGLAIGTFRSSPLTTIAFRFLEPQTAPSPVRPAARPPSLIIAENLTKFSPACPIHAIPSRCFPNLFFNIS